MFLQAGATHYGKTNLWGFIIYHYICDVNFSLMDNYRKSPRAHFLNYDCGDYFVTICTKDRKHFFGEIYDDAMHLSAIGRFLEEQLNSVEMIWPGISIPLFSIMPNHVHLIISISSDMTITAGGSEEFDQRNPNASQRANPDISRVIPPLSRYINSLKGCVTRYAKSIDSEFGWQARYHDHAIRNNLDGNNIAKYIIDNVAKWQEDELFDE